MVKIPAGRFWMGQTDAEKQQLISQSGEKDYQKYFASELPRHQVSLQSFFMGKFPVTQAQYQQIMGDNPSSFKDFPDSANHPVEQVTWLEADQFCQKLSQQTGRAYHLATEAEWEYSCRAGTETPFYFGETITTDYVNYDGKYPYGDAPNGEDRKQTTPVGQFFPNGFGLYDCHGNVWEWCADCWHDSYTDKSDSIKNNGSIIWSDSNESIRLLRGGFWDADSRYCRSAVRDRSYADTRHYGIGFRLALSLL
jgi:formylglycine-generating enzyme required for sulfatase activity